MNKEIKEILSFKEDCDYKKLSIEAIMLLQDYITDLEKRFNSLLEAHKICDEEEQEKRNIINKAIKYIKNNQCAIHEPTGIMKKMYGKILSEGNCDDLLDILQGSDKE